MGAWLSLDPSVAQQLDDGDKLAQSLKEKNEAELKVLDDKITDAEQNQGETELSDALRAKASYLAKIGEKVCVLPLLCWARLDLRSLRDCFHRHVRNERWRRTS